MASDLPPFTLVPPGADAPAGQPRRHPVLAQLGAVLAFTLATLVAFVAVLYLSFVLASSCGEPVDRGATLLLKAGVGVVGVLWTAVAALIARLSRPVHAALNVAWLVVAALATLVTLAMVGMAQASPLLCF